MPNSSPVPGWRSATTNRTKPGGTNARCGKGLAGDAYANGQKDDRTVDGRVDCVTESVLRLQSRRLIRYSRADVKGAIGRDGGQQFLLLYGSCDPFRIDRSHRRWILWSRCQLCAYCGLAKQR